MSLPFKKTDKIVQVLPEAFVGTITTIKVNADSGEVIYLATDAAGVDRWFTTNEIALVPPPAEETPAA
jgi:hypothetical protein